MTLKSLHKPVVMTFVVVALATLGFTLMQRAAEAAPPVIRAFNIVPGYTVPGYKRPLYFTPGYRPLPPYSLIFRIIR
jgi:hypothetical protein